MLKISKSIQAIFAIIFSLTIVSVITRGYLKYPAWKITFVIISGLMFTIFLIWLYGFLKKKTQMMTRKSINKIFICISVLVLILQIVSAFVLMFEPINDLNYVDTAARAFSQSWDKSDLYIGLPKYHYNYFARYPNNQALLIILSMIYFVTNKLFGVMPLIVPVLINTFALHISFVLTYLISTKIFKDKFTPLFCSIISAAFSVFYTYTPNFYTDSMSMPFALGAVYLFLKGIEKLTLRSKIPMLMLSGMLLVIGYKIKGSIIILIPAFIIYLIVTLNKKNKINYIKVICIFMAGITISTVLCSGFIKCFKITDTSAHEEIEFPPTHWIMMGLHDRGGYYENDFYATVNSGNYEQKIDYNIKEIKNRIADYGVLGMIRHLAKKVSYTWGDGTYFVGYYYRKNAKEHHSNIFQNFIANNNVFKWYCSAFQCMILIMILLSFIDGAFSKSVGKEILLKIILCGVYFFFILWEARSRYLVNFSPVFLMISAYEIRSIVLKLKMFSVKNKNMFLK